MTFKMMNDTKFWAFCFSLLGMYGARIGAIMLPIACIVLVYCYLFVAPKRLSDNEHSTINRAG